MSIRSHLETIYSGTKETIDFKAEYKYFFETATKKENHEPIYNEITSFIDAKLAAGETEVDAFVHRLSKITPYFQDVVVSAHTGWVTVTDYLASKTTAATSTTSSN